MGTPTNPLDAADPAGETKLRGETHEPGDHQEPHAADTEIRLDDEKDTLYDDGLEVEDDSEHLAGTRAADHRS